MMKEKLTAGVAAIAIYLGLITLLLYYFGYHHSSTPTHYVSKNREGISVSLAGLPTAQSALKSPPKPTRKAHHAKPRKASKSRKRAAKKRASTAPRPKQPDTRKLFSHLKKSSSQKPVERRAPGGEAGAKASGERSLKKAQGERGRENAYLAKVERLLKGWPAQANFAGEEIDIRLSIYPDGHFDYRILKLSANPDFNHALIDYLKQLQSIGFGPHTHGKPYEIEVRFIAHE